MKKLYKKIKWFFLYLIFSIRYKNELIFDEKNNAGNVAILISPWYESTVPFFSYFLCILLKKNLNKNVIIIHDDIYFSVEEFNPKYQYHLINKLLNDIPSSNIIKLSSLEDSEGIEEIDLSSLAYANLVHDTRAEVNLNPDLEFIYKNQINIHFKKIRTLFNTFSFDYLVVPGGISLSSGIFHSESKRINLRLITFDSGVDILQFCSSGVASHLDDLPNALQTIYKTYTKETCKTLEKAGKALLQDRIGGIDRFAYQKNSSYMSTDFNYVLLILNVPWDSAALLQLKYFKNQYDWVIKTIQFIILKTNNKIIIREHPADIGDNKSNTNYKKLIYEYFGDNNRIIFIRAEEKVNTYGLINQADLVVVNTSSVGLECALIGKKVITVSNPYYSKAQFVYSPDTLLNYFNCLLKHDESTLNFDVNHAYALYFLAQGISFGSSPIYPGNNFFKWIFKNKLKIYSDVRIKNLISVINDNIPYSLLNVKDLL